MDNKLQIFNFNNNTNIRSAILDDNIYFVAKDIAEALDYASPDKAYQNCKNIKSSPNYNLNKINNLHPATKWISEIDVKILIIKSETKSSNFKEKLYNFLFPNNNTTFLHSRVEIEFLDSLKQSLQPFGIEGSNQFKVLNYRIDFYIPKLNIAIEYDEESHIYKSSEDSLRQKEIEKEIGCYFIRINTRNTHAWNIGYVIKEILLLKKRIYYE